MISLVAVLALSLISLCSLIHILERKRENDKSSQYADLTEDQKMIAATKQSKSALFIAGIVLLLALAMICVPIRYIELAGISIVLSLIACVYTTICVAPALHSYMCDVHSEREKQKLSKNVTTNKD